MIGRPKLMLGFDEHFEPIALCARYTPDGKQLIVGGGLHGPDPDAIVDPMAAQHRGKSISNGAAWVIDRATGVLFKTIVDRRVFILQPGGLSMSGKKVHVTVAIRHRFDSILGGGLKDADQEFVEIQQWDTETWERDWIKFRD